MELKLIQITGNYVEDTEFNFIDENSECEINSNQRTKLNDNRYLQFLEPLLSSMLKKRNSFHVYKVHAI